MRGERLARGLRATARGALVAWLMLLVLAQVSAPAAPEWPALLLLPGTASLLPLACFLLVGLLIAPFIPGSAAREAAGWRPLLLVLGAELLLWFALTSILVTPAATLVPSRFAYPALIARVAVAHLSTILAAGACWLAWRRAGSRTAAFPIWTLAPLHLVARLYTRDDVALVGPGHEFELDLASTLFCVLAGTRWGQPSPPERELKSIVPAMIVAVLVALLAASRMPSALTALNVAYPGPAAALASLRKYYDLDGDGFTGLLGGVDCDDDHPLVGPMALEIVGNGIDDNCMGGDLASHTPLPPPRRVTEPPHHNLVMIVVDTLRAGAVASGMRPAPMPEVDAFSRNAALFERAYSQAPYTGQAMRALVTGQWPMNTSIFEVPLGMEPTLAVALNAAGYQTSAIVQFDEIKRGSQARAQTSSILTGFERVDWSLRQQNIEFRGVTSPETTRKALAELAQLRASQQPFYLLVHYFDPHAEYVAHAGTPFSSDTLAGRYWQEVFETDREIGALLDQLERTGFYDDGYVLLTADHGELLGEHNRFMHALWLDEPALHIPLVLRGPGVPPGRYSTRVRQIDIAPTLLDLTAGIAAPMPGRNLAEVWSGRDQTDRDVIALTTYDRRVAKRAIMRGPYKLEIDLLGASRLLTRTDAAEPSLRNLIDEQPEVADDLQQTLGEVWDRAMNDRILARRRGAGR